MSMFSRTNTSERYLRLQQGNLLKMCLAQNNVSSYHYLAFIFNREYPEITIFRPYGLWGPRERKAGPGQPWPAGGLCK